MKVRFVFYALLTAALCTARLQTDRQTEEIDTATSFLLDLLCLRNGTVCDVATTCSNCCAKESYIAAGTLQSTCGAEPPTSCLVNGTSCSNETHYECYDCCNGHFADNGSTCGGECLAAGTTCGNKTLYSYHDSLCHLCCDGTILKEDLLVCGCLEDGIPCIDDECYSCCNGAFDDGGKKCGGQCLESGAECTNRGKNPTCHLCCNYTYWRNNDDKYQCGCIEDGEACVPGDTCYHCCNGAFDDGGKKCGGQCLESGTECTVGSRNPTCNLCCNNTYWRNNDDKYQCGCIEDGEACVPGDNCYNCCNGNYNDGGYTCGGQCIEDGMECIFGEDCNLCCTGSSYWQSSGKLHCGTEPCYKDGESCIPGMNCDKCCSGGAYDGEGTKCGGTCIPSGTECTYHSNCTKCCNNYTDTTSTSTDDSYGFSSSSYSYPMSSKPYHWDNVQESMKCGYEMCKKDGTACIRGFDCYSCCNSNYDWNSTCGGSCIPTGTKCNYFDSTCDQCCETRSYNDTVGYFMCTNYTDYDYSSSESDYPSKSATPSSVPYLMI